MLPVMQFSRYMCAHPDESRSFLVNKTFSMCSGDREIRTLDPLLARQVLSQLSYAPRLHGLKWTRTTDLTLIRRAL